MTDRIDYIAPNPSDSEDTQTDPGTVSGDYGKVTMSDPPQSTTRPDIFDKELYFKDEKTKYYHDESITIYVKVKNAGISVNPAITAINQDYYRFEGEKINDDVKKIGSDNIKGENLPSGATKSEDIKIGAPDEEKVYQFFVEIDTANAVAEANESNNRLGNIRCRVHKRPNIYVKDFVVGGGRTSFELWEMPEARVTFSNKGGEPFVDIPVRWYLDNIHFADDNMRHWNIENGDEKHESVNLVNLSAGRHALKVCADFSEDSYKSDNCRTINFSVLYPVNPMTASGDFNLDGRVDIFDYSIFVGNFGSTDCGNPADATGDCYVGLEEYDIIIRNFGSGVVEQPTVAAAGGASDLTEAQVLAFSYQEEETTQTASIQDVYMEGAAVNGGISLEKVCCEQADIRWDIYYQEEKQEEKFTSWQPNGCWGEADIQDLLVASVKEGEYRVEVFVSQDGGEYAYLTEIAFQGEGIRAEIPDEPETEAPTPQVSGGGGGGGGCFIDVLLN